MKKSINGIGTIVLIMLVSIFIASCDYFNRPMLDYLEEWTNTAQVSKHTFDDTYPVIGDITNIPSGKDRVITYYLINPQNYTLDSSVTFAHDDSLVVNNKTPSDFATVEQDASDKSIIRLTLKDSVGATGILPLDGDGTEITPTITIREPNSGRFFGSYTVPVRVNSAPLDVSSPIILCNTKDNTYVICFNMPDMNTTSSLHRDIVSLTVSGFYSNTYTVTAPDNSSGNGLTGVISSYNDTNYREVDGSFIGNKTSRFVGIETGISLNTVSDPRCTITLTDSSGLTSVVTASTEAPPLPAVTASFGSGTLEPGVPVIFNQETAGSTITLTLSNAEGVAVSGGTLNGNTITGSSGITLTFLKKGSYTVTATAGGISGSQDTTTTFTYTVPYSAVYIADTTADGSDDTGIGSPDKPYASLTKAAGAIGNDGVVYVKGTVSVSGEYAHSFGNLTLRGYDGVGTLINNSGRVLNITGGSLTLVENITLTGTNANGNGGAVYVDGGTFTMESGSKITGSSASSGGGVYVADGSFTMNGSAKLQGNKATTHGGGVHIYSDGTFTMNGGTIDGTIGGTAANTAENGGGVFVSRGTFNMNGGTITGNKVTKSGGGVCISGGTFTMSGGAVISGNTATSSGGGVFVSESGDFTMKGGTIGGSGGRNPNSAENGGGVYIFKGTFTMSGDAVISGNKASSSGSSSSGGGVYVSKDGAFTMEGGTIGGHDVASANSSESGGGVCISGGTFTMSDGSILGNNATDRGDGVFVQGGTFTLSGSPNISGNYRLAVEKNNNVYLANGKTITIGDGGLNTSARIGVTTETSPAASTEVPITDTAVDGAESIFIPDAEGCIIMSKEGAVYLADSSSFEVSWDTGSGVQYGSFADAISALNTSSSGGTIILQQDIDDTNNVFGTSNNQPITFSGGKESNPVILDLNGHTINRALGTAQADGTVISVSGALTLKDSTGSGKITGGNNNNSTTSGTWGGGVCVQDGAFFTMEGGNISYNFSEIGGGGVYVCNGGSFTMTGGTIGGSGVNDGNMNTSTSYGGGGVFVNGEFTMSGGTITGNITDANGGGVAVTADGTFTMSGTAVISANEASNGSGGGVYSAADFTMTGGTIGGTGGGSPNSAENGGGVYMINSKKITMDGGAISGNTATTNGGGLYLYDGSTAEIGKNTSGSAPQISSNTATDGGGIYLGTSAKVELVYGTIGGSGSTTGNTATDKGGGVYAGSGSTFIMDGESAIIENNKINSVSGFGRGGGIYSEGGTLEMKNGSITGNNAESSGGGVYISSTIFTMTDGEISGNYASSGGGVTVGSAGTFSISSPAVVSGNTISSVGGENVYVDVSTGGKFIDDDNCVTEGVYEQ